MFDRSKSNSEKLLELRQSGKVSHSLSCNNGVRLVVVCIFISATFTKIKEWQQHILTNYQTGAVGLDLIFSPFIQWLLELSLVVVLATILVSFIQTKFYFSFQLSTQSANRAKDNRSRMFLDMINMYGRILLGILFSSIIFFLISYSTLSLLNIMDFSDELKKITLASELLAQKIFIVSFVLGLLYSLITYIVNRFVFLHIKN